MEHACIEPMSWKTDGKCAIQTREQSGILLSFMMKHTEIWDAKAMNPMNKSILTGNVSFRTKLTQRSNSTESMDLPFSVMQLKDMYQDTSTPISMLFFYPFNFVHLFVQ
eukprot:568154_1